jgi:hypothetical protein
MFLSRTSIFRVTLETCKLGVVGGTSEERGRTDAPAVGVEDQPQHHKALTHNIKITRNTRRPPPDDPTLYHPPPKKINNAHAVEEEEEEGGSQ